MTIKPLSRKKLGHKNKNHGSTNRFYTLSPLSYPLFCDMSMAHKITILLWCQTVHKILIDKMIVVVISDPNRCCKISFHTSSTVQKEN